MLVSTMGTFIYGSGTLSVILGVGPAHTVWLNGLPKLYVCHNDSNDPLWPTYSGFINGSIYENVLTPTGIVPRESGLPLTRPSRRNYIQTPLVSPGPLLGSHFVANISTSGKNNTKKIQLTTVG